MTVTVEEGAGRQSLLVLLLSDPSQFLGWVVSVSRRPAELDEAALGCEPGEALTALMDVGRKHHPANPCDELLRRMKSLGSRVVVLVVDGPQVVEDVARGLVEGGDELAGGGDVVEFHPGEVVKEDVIAEDVGDVGSGVAEIAGAKEVGIGDGEEGER